MREGEAAALLCLREHEGGIMQTQTDNPADRQTDRLCEGNVWCQTERRSLLQNKP